MLLLLAATNLVVLTTCAEAVTAIRGLERSCLLAIAEEDFRTAVAGGQHVWEYPEDITDGFPFVMSDPDEVLAQGCAEQLLINTDKPSDTCTEEQKAETKKIFESHRIEFVSSLRKQKESFRSSDGYGKTRWGMTRREVRQLVSGTKNDGEGLVVAIEIDGKRAVVGYAFVEDKLVNVMIVFNEMHIGAQQYAADFYRIKQLLTAKYGDADKEGTEYTSDLARETFGALGANAISLGEARMTAKWEREKTTIDAACYPSGFGAITNAIVYASVELLEWADGKRNTKSGEDL